MQDKIKQIFTLCCKSLKAALNKLNERIETQIRNSGNPHKYIALYVASLLLIIIAVISLLCFLFSSDGGINDETSDAVVKFTWEPTVERPEVAHRISNINFNGLFKDKNDKHLQIARKIGINPLDTRADADKSSKKIVAIDDFEAYEVDELTHSIPYLVPEAAALLARIGQNFQDSLVMKHLPPHKIIVTSVLRTLQDVKSLRKRNVNSTANSAHCYATTFDITYKRFMSAEGEVIPQQDKLKRVLGEVLRDLRNEEHCYVMHERKQACFHITARSYPKKRK